MWLAYAAGSAFFAGITSILAKIGIKDTDSHLATALRTVVVAVFSWCIVFSLGLHADIRAIDTRSIIFLGLSGLSTGASWLCYFKALQLGDVSKVVPIDKSSTVLAMLLAFAFLGEEVTALKALCMFLIMAGTLLMLERKKAGQGKEAGVWLLYAALSALFAALTSILGKIGIENVDSNLGTALRTLVVLVMAWLIVFITRKQREIKSINTKSWFFLILSGLATGASWLCYYRALQEGAASVVVPIDKLSILVTIAFSYIALRERLSKKSVIGLFMIVAGTLLLLVK